jgi:hypothetical protein
MDLFLNGERAVVDTHDCANLAELIARAEALGDAAERSVVVAVEIDGRVLPPEELGLLETRRLDEVSAVRVERRPSTEVARSVLVQGADYTTRIVEAIAAVADDYRAGRSEQANRVLADVLDSISVLTGITYSISGTLADEAQALGALQGEIHPWLEEMLDAQTGEDLIRIADVLEYEIAPRLERWGDTMRAFSAASAPPAGGR